MSKIRAVTPIPCRFERAEPYLGATTTAPEADYFLRPPYRALYSRYYETTFVRIESDEGQIGWGECLAPISPRVSAAIIEDILGPALIGMDPLATSYLRSHLYDLMRDRGYFGGFFVDAITACDIALWDLKGKQLGESITGLIGGPFRDRVPCYVSGIGQTSDEDRMKYAEGWAKHGFRRFKHAGGYGVDADAETVRRLFEGLGGDIVVGIDGHWAFTPPEAERLGVHLAEFGETFLEAPIDPEDVGTHARLADRLTVPVATGEALRTRHEFRSWLTTAAIDIAQPDVGRAGITETLAIASMAETFSVPVAPHLSVQLGPVIAASIHVAASIPNLYLLEFQPPTVELANRFLREGIEVEAGEYVVPDGPGLGIQVNEERIRELQV